MSDRIAAAKLYLVSEPTQDLPYLAHAIYALITVPSDQVERMSVDEHWRLYVNPQWLARTEVPQIAAEMAHLTWHLLRDHAGRARDLRVTPATAAFWQSASDAALSEQLAEEDLLPDGLATPESLGLQEGRSSEEYYAQVSRLPATDPDAFDPGQGDPIAGCGSGADGLRRAHELPADASAGAIHRGEVDEIRRRVAIAFTEHVSTRGTEEGGLGRWARQILKPQIPWQAVLSRAVRHATGWANGHAEHTYTRRSRRQSAVPQVILPGTRRPLPYVAMVIDTSASVDDVLLGQALGEVDGALRGLGVPDASVTVLACDTAVHTVERIRRVGDVSLVGAGGTDLCVGLETAVGCKPRPNVIVALTDGFTPWPEVPPPGIAVVCALLGRHGYELPPTPPWLTRVECLVDG